MDTTNIWSIAFFLFLLMDAIGNVPLYISFLKKVSPSRQRVVILREMVIALIITFLFLFGGDWLLNFLKISNDAVQITGGIILFIICFRMIFPKTVNGHEEDIVQGEPFIVPLAVPFVAGPAILTAVIVYSRQDIHPWILVGAIFIAWVPSLLILLASSYLKVLLGDRGISATEKLMGLVLSLIAVQMFLTGVDHFMNHPSDGSFASSQQIQIPCITQNTNP